MQSSYQRDVASDIDSLIARLSFISHKQFLEHRVSSATTNTSDCDTIREHANFSVENETKRKDSIKDMYIAALKSSLDSLRTKDVSTHSLQLPYILGTAEFQSSDYCGLNFEISDDFKDGENESNEEDNKIQLIDDAYNDMSSAENESNSEFDSDFESDDVVDGVLNGVKKSPNHTNIFRNRTDSEGSRKSLSGEASASLMSNGNNAETENDDWSDDDGEKPSLVDNLYVSDVPSKQEYHDQMDFRSMLEATLTGSMPAVPRKDRPEDEDLSDDWSLDESDDAQDTTNVDSKDNYNANANQTPPSTERNTTSQVGKQKSVMRRAATEDKAPSLKASQEGRSKLRDSLLDNPRAEDNSTRRQSSYTVSFSNLLPKQKSSLFDDIDEELHDTIDSATKPNNKYAHDAPPLSRPVRRLYRSKSLFDESDDEDEDDNTPTKRDEVRVPKFDRPPPQDFSASEIPAVDTTSEANVEPLVKTVTTFFRESKKDSSVAVKSDSLSSPISRNSSPQDIKFSTVTSTGDDKNRSPVNSDVRQAVRKSLFDDSDEDDDMEAASNLYHSKSIERESEKQNDVGIIASESPLKAAIEESVEDDWSDSSCEDIDNKPLSLEDLDKAKSALTSEAEVKDPQFDFATFEPDSEQKVGSSNVKSLKETLQLNPDMIRGVKPMRSQSKGDEIPVIESISQEATLDLHHTTRAKGPRKQRPPGGVNPPHKIGDTVVPESPVSSDTLQAEFPVESHIIIKEDNEPTSNMNRRKVSSLFDDDDDDLGSMILDDKKTGSQILPHSPLPNKDKVQDKTPAKVETASNIRKKMVSSLFDDDDDDDDDDGNDNHEKKLNFVHSDNGCGSQQNGIIDTSMKNDLSPNNQKPPPFPLPTQRPRSYSSLFDDDDDDDDDDW